MRGACLRFVKESCDATQRLSSGGAGGDTQPALDQASSEVRYPALTCNELLDAALYQPSQSYSSLNFLVASLDAQQITLPFPLEHCTHLFQAELRRKCPVNS